MNNVLKLDIFSDYTAISHAISTQAFGSMKKEDLSIHHANLLKFLKTVKIDNAPICMNQIHSGNVVVVENNRELIVPNTDTLITNKKKLPLAVITADCLPILLYDHEKEIIGVAHAGYKGLLNNIIGNTIEKFVTEFGSDPKDILIGVGPSIEPSCYEVGKEVIDQFEKAFPNFTNMYKEEHGKYFLDMRAIALECFKKEGILEDNIDISASCTKCSESFYSYRAGDKNGRFVSVISLV